MFVSPLMYWKQAHADVFGDFDVDAIDNVGLDYESKYDDFM